MEDTFLRQSKINFSKEVNNYYPEILTDEALVFITELHEKFNSERLQLLERRVAQQKVFDNGKFLKFRSQNIYGRSGRQHCPFLGKYYYRATKFN